MQILTIYRCDRGNSVEILAFLVEFIACLQQWKNRSKILLHFLKRPISKESRPVKYFIVFFIVSPKCMTLPLKG